MRLCRAEAEVDKLAEALREQSRIHAPDMKTSCWLKDRKSKVSPTKWERDSAAQFNPHLSSETPLSGKGGLSQVDAGKETSDSDIWKSDRPTHCDADLVYVILSP